VASLRRRELAVVALAIACCTACGAKSGTSAPLETSPAAGPTTNATTVGPIVRRLRAAGYPIYPIAPDDPHSGALFYTQVDWATQHAFKLYVYPFPTASAASAFAKRWSAGDASFLEIVAAGRVVYWATGGEYEFYGGKSETEPLPEKDFRTIVAIADGRR
jgi:hypothetical protein